MSKSIPGPPQCILFNACYSKDQYYLDFNERSAEHLLRNSRETLKEAVCVERAMKRHNFHLVEFPA